MKQSKHSPAFVLPITLAFGALLALLTLTYWRHAALMHDIIYERMCFYQKFYYLDSLLQEIIIPFVGNHFTELSQSLLSERYFTIKSTQDEIPSNYQHSLMTKILKKTNQATIIALTLTLEEKNEPIIKISCQLCRNEENGAIRIQNFTL